MISPVKAHYMGVISLHTRAFAVTIVTLGTLSHQNPVFVNCIRATDHEFFCPDLSGQHLRFSRLVFVKFDPALTQTIDLLTLLCL